jgi:hypothetical protein
MAKKEKKGLKRMRIKGIEYKTYKRCRWGIQNEEEVVEIV